METIWPGPVFKILSVEVVDTSTTVIAAGVAVGADVVIVALVDANVAEFIAAVTSANESWLVRIVRC